MNAIEYLKDPHSVGLFHLDLRPPTCQSPPTTGPPKHQAVSIKTTKICKNLGCFCPTKTSTTQMGSNGIDKMIWNPNVSKPVYQLRSQITPNMKVPYPSRFPNFSNSHAYVLRPSSTGIRRTSREGPRLGSSSFPLSGDRLGADQVT